MDSIADTSAVIKLSRGDARTIAVMTSRDFAITFVTLAEVLLGIRKAQDQGLSRRRTNAVISGRPVIYATKNTPSFYVEVCHELENKGARIPQNDMWIAALALERKLPVIGRDAHFERVKDLVFIPC